MKVLQIASFNGNIGDIANHVGFRQSLMEKLGEDIEFTNLEMRRFYRNWNECKFDEMFVEYANQFDLVVFGGGGFFELKWNYSQTGTTIDVSNDILGAIKPPIIFNCIGTKLPREGVQEEIADKFKNFLDYCLASPKILFTVRNDGTLETLCDLYGQDYQKRILKVPDGGFYVKLKDYIHYEVNEGEKYIAINIAGDMPEVRFPGNAGLINREDFITSFVDFIKWFLEWQKDYRVVFVPHIFKDYQIISDVLEGIPDKFLRLRVSCAPCLNGTTTDGLANFDIYRRAALTVGMRYHANVCSIGLGVPTIGICTLDSHIKLYSDIGLEHRCIEANKDGYAKRLKERVEDVFVCPEKYINENREVMYKNNYENAVYLEQIKKLIEAVIREK